VGSALSRGRVAPFALNPILTRGYGAIAIVAPAGGESRPNSRVLAKLRDENTGGKTAGVTIAAA
jgi:hypothetical protein